MQPNFYIPFNNSIYSGVSKDEKKKVEFQKWTKIYHQSIIINVIIA